MTAKLFMSKEKGASRIFQGILGGEKRKTHSVINSTDEFDQNQVLGGLVLAWYNLVIMRKTALFVSLLPLLIGCGNELECALKGDNGIGRLTFSPFVAVSSVGAVRIEWSTDSFTTVAGGRSFENIHGLPTFVHTLCLDNNKDFSFRAYQDLNLNGLLDSGEVYGRFDGTVNGDGSYLTKNIPSETASSKWPIVSGIDIVVDSP